VREAPNGLISVVGGKWTTYRAMAEDAVDAAIASARLDARPCVTAQLPIHRSAPLAALDERSLATAVADAVRYEQAHRVDDVLARRYRLLFLDVASAIRLAPAVADALARESGRDLAWRDAELQRFVTLASRYQVEPSGPSLF
jgi:glycerol-3-phosphate dehydrogenase